ncbi:hypothetical protein [Succinivibrio dextrinosolvens]|uniref:hypothetical protein n=1 Tax=Succinivibrio dextrinosolvens TaxID=83771 RepID=UPI00241E8D92|nr:hypothetical protein [Succinivibrio dextrinosolvens]MBE6422566.1 hypothetical protein [Succinivibrio dextrinosolvens]
MKYLTLIFALSAFLCSPVFADDQLNEEQNKVEKNEITQQKESNNSEKPKVKKFKNGDALR